MWYERNINVFRTSPLGYMKHNTNDNLMLMTIWPSPLFTPTFQNQNSFCKKPYFIRKFAMKYRPQIDLYGKLMTSCWQCTNIHAVLVTLVTSILDPNWQTSISKKGKNCIIKEECQLCVSFMHFSQDPKIRNGKKKTHFGTRCLKITTKIESLNGLQDCWKHNGGKKNDVAKFCGC
jgi:hypothetical protein